MKSLPKYQQILQELRERIHSGRYRPGDRLPSEAALVQQFGASRLTVGRALKELQLEGLAVRRAGSGSYARLPAPAAGHVFGLLIPDLGRTEIFEPICQGMMDTRPGCHHSLLWGNSFTEAGRQSEQARELCHHYIDSKVSGVFFAPLEWVENKDETNQRIAADLTAAGIPLVLLDRCLAPFPLRSPFDLIGIDNRRAGFAITEHLLRLGAQRIAFIARPYSAPTVDGRIAGYREALQTYGVPPTPGLVQHIDAADSPALRRLLEYGQPDAFVCANDHTAALLVQTLQSLGIEVPEDARVTGIDDVKYASLLPVPLTTIHQPCQEMGIVALAAMLERLTRPDLPAREIRLDFTLVVRQSCGAVAPRSNGV